MRESRDELESSIAAALAVSHPDVEVVDLEARGGHNATLTLFIDRPGGVDLELCAAVSTALDGFRDRYVLEVSSPGLNRRLRKPTHFAAVVGCEVVVKTTSAIDGRRNFRGVLLVAESDSITLELEQGERVALPLAAIARANAVYDFANDGGHRE